MSSTSSSSGSRWFVPSSVQGIWESLVTFKRELGLPHPGTVENLSREIKNMLVRDFFIDGARADIAKVMSLDPTFQVVHTFQLPHGAATSGGNPLMGPSGPSPYQLVSVFANKSTFMQAMIDNEGNLQSHLKQAWSDSQSTKVQVSVASSHNMLQTEHDINGPDFALNFKAINPSPTLDGSGIYLASFLQAITPNCALGVELIHQRPKGDKVESSISYLAKFTGGKDAAQFNSSTFLPSGANVAMPGLGHNRRWIATMQWQPSMRALNSTYWQQISDKVEAGAEIQAVVGGRQREAIATLGAKYSFRMATFRGQVDSQGKVAMLVEQAVNPALNIMLCGEIDHFKNTARFGIGVQIEVAPNISQEQMMAQQQKQQQQQQTLGSF